MGFFRFRLKKREDAQATVELAVLLPVFTLILLGILEFGWWLNGYIALTGAARVGVRIATVDDETAAAAAVSDDLSSTAIENVNVSFSYGIDEITVTVTGELRPLVGLLLQNPIELTATAVMYLQ